MTLDVHEERRRFRETGMIDPLYAASESHNDVAKQRLREAAASCDVWKAHANLKAKMIVENLRMNFSSGQTSKVGGGTKHG